MTMHLPIQGSVYDLPRLDAGVSSVVYAISNKAVIKTPCGTDKSRSELAIKRKIYDRLGPRPRIAELLDARDDMIVLERL